MRISGFISKAACRGYRPAKLSSTNDKQRPHLIARLAKERANARFIVAPDGYGKTSLALDYAETMFSWTHVFWINAQSPCFIRDLDGRVIASACATADPEVRLVVIDDLPQLDSVRAEALSAEIDLLLARSCEVVVSCVPSCDLFGSLQIDRVRIGARDLLLSDEEVDSVRSEDDRMRLSSTYVPSAARVPALVWGGSPADAASFIAGNLDEGLPTDLLLATCSAFAIHVGSLADLAAIGPIDGQLMSESLEDYPHLGYDPETERFEAPLVDAELLARAAKGRMDAMIDRSRFETRDELVKTWAAVLLERAGDGGRACDIVRAFCPVKRRASWLVDHARELMGCGCFLSVHKLANSLKSGSYEDRPRVGATDALCLLMLGDEEAAVHLGKRYAFQADCPRDARVVCLLIVAAQAPGELRANAESALHGWAAAYSGVPVAGLPWHDSLVVAWEARRAGAEELCEVWLEMHKAAVDDDVLCLAASWLFAKAGNAWTEGGVFRGELAEPVEMYVRSRLSEDEGRPAGFFATSAGLSMEAAHEQGMPLAGGPLPARILLDLRRAEMAALMQRRAFERSRDEERVLSAELVHDGNLYGGTDSGLSPVARRPVPILEVRLFGCFDVAIGGVPLAPKQIGRKLARVLLLVLVANRGRDISRDAVAQSMWPGRDVVNARKNFYTTWSQLRRALTLPDGTCPYLVRHQYGCRLDERYVKSDLARLDDICRELLFGRVDFDSWIDMHAEIDRDFAGELLPVEGNMSLVVKVRDDCHDRLVEALVTASQRLVEAGNPQYAIWFARSATDRERTREDAYVALMRAQIASDQRTAAMMTYLNCRRVLAEELGIDPSPEMTSLYESLLGS